MSKVYVEDEKGAKNYKSYGDVSDGYHTFDELYHYRMLYNAGFFNLLHKLDDLQGMRYQIHKSKRHSTGELCFGGGWFVVSAKLPMFGQVTNHYEMKHWDLFNAPEQAKADPWDGHTPQQAAERIEMFLRHTV